MIGIKFSHYGQICYFDCADVDVVPGERVLAETSHGLGLGLVVMMAEQAPADIPVESIVPIVRRAGEQDMVAAVENDALAHSARHFCEIHIRERELDMKLVDVEVLFDRSKLVFYFTAPTRIDFRELVKDLVREYHTRIELRQIGVRHETQMLGAVGSCGMVCCCRRFLRKFVPVTIKMAKEQNLFLNPSKISGICGRLLCCLSYEQENYDIFHRNCPRLGKRYQTNRGPLKILRANLFRNSIAVLTEANEEVEFTLDEWRDLDPRRPDAPAPGKGETGACSDSSGHFTGHGEPDESADYGVQPGSQLGSQQGSQLGAQLGAQHIPQSAGQPGLREPAAARADAALPADAGEDDFAERDASDGDFADGGEEDLRATETGANSEDGRDENGDARRRRRRRRK